MAGESTTNKDNGNKADLELQEQDDGSVSVLGLGEEEGAANGTTPPDGEGAGSDAGSRADNNAGTAGEGAGGSDDEHDDDEDDEGAANTSTTPETLEAKRERRRLERQQRRQQAREREATRDRELAQARQQIAQLTNMVQATTRRVSSSEMARLDSALVEAQGNYTYYKQLAADAMTAQNGAAWAEASERMAQAERRVAELSGVKNRVQQQAQLEARRHTTTTPANAPGMPPAPNPVVVQKAQAWAAQNAWYDPQQRDMDSRIAYQVDNALSDEGWDPSTDAYWKEYNARLAKYLPHRVKTGINPANGSGKPSPRSITTGSGREASATGAGGNHGYTLSADRVQALKDAGMWNDPDERAKAIRYYRDHDRKAAAGTQR